MHDFSSAGTLLATLSKHRIVGIVAIIVGAIFVVFGGARMLSKAATAPLIPMLGIAAILVGVLLFARVI